MYDTWENSFVSIFLNSPFKIDRITRNRHQGLLYSIYTCVYIWSNLKTLREIGMCWLMGVSLNCYSTHGNTLMCYFLNFPFGIDRITWNWSGFSIGFDLNLGEMPSSAFKIANVLWNWHVWFLGLSLNCFIPHGNTLISLFSEFSVQNW